MKEISVKMDQECGSFLNEILKLKTLHVTILPLSASKQALATVADYSPLMKDFPLNDLLSATELDRIRQALVSIFIHLRKIRNTKYPIQRALRLVEAISRDLSQQLLKVNIVRLNEKIKCVYIKFAKNGNWLYVISMQSL